MKSYEAMVIFSSKLDEEAVNALTAKFNDLIEATQATLHLVIGASVSWLMLSIMKQKVLYVLWSFTSTPEFPAELERILGITDGVIRFLVTVK